MNMSDPRYTLDGHPVSAKDLMSAAAALDQRYADDWLQMTSTAASILRREGHDVDHNPDWPPKPKTG